MAGWVGLACLAVTLVLLAGGGADHEFPVRVVQSAPLWIGVVFGLRRASAALWAGAPLLLIWGALAAATLLANAAVWTSPLPGALWLSDWMAIAIAVPVFAGLVATALMRGAARTPAGPVVAIVVVILQLAAMAASTLPLFDRDLGLVIT